MPTLRLSRLFAIGVLVLQIQTRVAAAPTTAPSLSEVQRDYDARHYSDVIKKVASALQPGPDEPISADHQKMLELKAESHLRLKQYALAADAFAAAAKQATDPKEVALLRSTILLVRRSAGNGQYQPKSTPNAPPEAKPPPIDIVDNDSRNSALIALFNDESRQVGKKVDELKAESTLPTLLGGIDQIRDLRELEIAAMGGQDALSRQLLRSLSDRADQIMTVSLNEMTQKVQAVSRNANQNTSFSHTLNNDGLPQTVGNKRGLGPPGEDLLDEVLANCDRIVAACDTLSDALKASGDGSPSPANPGRRRSAANAPSAVSLTQLQKLKAQATQLSARVREVLGGDYKAGTSRGGRTD